MSSTQESIKKTADTQVATIESTVKLSSPDGNVVTEFTIELEDVLDQQPHCSKNIVGNKSSSPIRTYLKKNRVKIKPSPSGSATRAGKRKTSSDDEGIYKNKITKLTIELEDVLDQQINTNKQSKHFNEPHVANVPICKSINEEPHCSKNPAGNESSSPVRTYLKENRAKIKPSPSGSATRVKRKTRLFAGSDAGESLGWSSDDEGIYKNIITKLFFMSLNLLSVMLQQQVHEHG